MGYRTHLSPAAKHLVVWFPSYAWLTTSAVTPFVYYAKLKHERVEPQQRKILVAQETCRQIVSGAGMAGDGDADKAASSGSRNGTRGARLHKRNQNRVMGEGRNHADAGEADESGEQAGLRSFGRCGR